MAQTGYTPISIYYSSTATNVPTAGNLVAGELAINTADGKLFYKDSAGVVQVIGTKGGVGSSTTTQVLYNNAGTVAGSANLIFNGTNLGLGITPNAAWSSFSAIQLGGNTYNAIASSNSYMAVYANTYYDGTNFKYVSTAGASTYTQNGGAHYFSVASSGTAGNNITFTQAMVINGSGNVGIANSTPQGVLDVGGANGGSAGDLLVVNTSTTAQVTVGRLSGTSSDNTNFRVRNRVDADAFFVNAGNKTAYVGTTFGVGATTPATTGAGITFPATQSASSDANTLDDYEEGTWTPVIATDGTQPTGATYSFQAGRYTKIGRMVQIQFIMACSNKGTGGTGILFVGGLPFTSANDGVYATATGTVCNPTVAVTSPFLQINPNVNYLVAISGNGATATSVTWANAANNIDIRCTMCYQV
jgi:hypothetical protein